MCYPGTPGFIKARELIENLLCQTGPQRLMLNKELAIVST